MPAERVRDDAFLLLLLLHTYRDHYDEERSPLFRASETQGGGFRAVVAAARR